PAVRAGRGAARRARRRVVRLRGSPPWGDRGVPRPLPGGDRGGGYARRGPDPPRGPLTGRSVGRCRAVRTLRPAHPRGPARAHAPERPPALTRPRRHPEGLIPVPHTPAADAVDEDPAVGAPYDTGPVAPTPQGPDQTDRVIIAAAEEIGTGCPCGLIVVDDATGELTAF